MRLCIFALLVLFSRPATAQDTADECNPESLAIFYVNGMFNDRLTAINSHSLLARSVDDRLAEEGASEEFRQNIEYGYSINEAESWYLQILETARQANNDIHSQFWNWLYTESGPDWFNDIVINVAADITQDEFEFDEDLTNHVRMYNNVISQDKRVLLVPHSQGNFYANSAYDVINSPSIGIVAVATPAGKVSGNGPYTTLTGDLVIQASIALNITRLPPNTTNTGNQLRTFKGHDFVRDYLYGIQSGRKITDDIIDQVETLPSPCDAPEIVSLSFPATVANAPGTLVVGSIDFKDRNRDLMQLCNNVVSGIANSFCANLENVAGLNEGTIPLEWHCPESVSSCAVTEVVVDATLVDAAGNVSQPYRYSFNVVQGGGGKQSGTGAPVVPRSP